MNNFNDFVNIKPLKKIIIKKNSKNTKKKDNDHKKNIKSLYKTNNNKPIIYDKLTMKTYVAIRKTKVDPITLNKTPTENIFQFHFQWDPYTGQRLDKDPYGPLCFNVVILAHYFYINRLNHLWINPSDERNGYFQGIYGEAVGIGKNFSIKGRGNFPEWYLFRIPIPNCYLTDDHNIQIPTFGPELTNKEILEINSKLHSNNRYQKMFYNNPPDLVQMKKLYDKAISQTPRIRGVKNLTPQQILERRYKANRKAVDYLRKRKTF